MNDITVKELKEKLEGNDSFLFLDVREPFEYSDFNLGAKLIPLGEVQEHLADISDWKNKEVIVHCRSGARSAAAKQILVNNGFTNVRNVLGGILDWMDNFGATKPTWKQ